MTLLIVDLQDGFEAARYAVPGALLEIQKAKLNKEKVIFACFKGFGNIIKDLIIKCAELELQWFRVLKSQNSAYRSLIDSNLLSLEETIRICGVNTDYCVKETINDLVRNHFEVEILLHACFSHELTFDEFLLEKTSNIIYEYCNTENPSFDGFVQFYNERIPDQPIPSILGLEKSGSIKFRSLFDLPKEEMREYFKYNASKKYGKHTVPEFRIISSN